MKELTGVFGMVFTTGGGCGLLGLLIWAIGPGTVPGLRDPMIFVTFGLVLVVIAGVLLLRAADKEN